MLHRNLEKRETTKIKYKKHITKAKVTRKEVQVFVCSLLCATEFFAPKWNVLVEKRRTNLVVSSLQTS